MKIERIANIKRFIKKHKVKIILVTVGVIGATGLVYLAVKKGQDVTKTINSIKNNTGWINNWKEQLDKYGVEWKEGYSVPFTTKDTAIKFMEERGNTYQIDILDELTSVIWISGGEA